MGRILLISRDEEHRGRLADGLRARSYTVEEARGVMPVAARPDRIVVDVARAAAPGVAMLPVLRDAVSAWPGVPTIILAPFPTAALMHTALRLGAVHCIARTDDATTVLAAFDEAEQPVTAEARPAAFATLEEARWQHIGRALEASKGNISTAAKLLGLHRQSLQRMLRSLRRDGAAVTEAEPRRQVA